MRIASTTLVGPGTLEVLEDALSTVARAVDLCILIPTSPELEDRELRRCARRAGFREDTRSMCVRYEWKRDDFAAARNFALDVAALNDCDWCVTLDTDERLISGRMPSVGLDALELQELLAGSSGRVAMVTAEDGSYAKERCFRLPCVERWHGRTHEFFPFVPGRWTLPGVRFKELGKSPEQLARKFRRDEAILFEMVRDEPDSARWRYYQGESFAGLGQVEAAIAAFQACASMHGWDEEGAWAAYRAADLEARVGRYTDAVETCARGLARHAGMSELAWLAGFCAYKLGRFEQAVFWETMAASTGAWSGIGRYFERVGFRHPPASYEGPYDVLRFAYRALGQEQAANLCSRKHEWATRYRLGIVDEPNSETPPAGEEPALADHAGAAPE